MRSEIHIFPFTNRLGRFAKQSLESYVGPRVFPRLALLYAAGVTYHSRGRYLFVKEFIESYIEDRYYSDITRSGDYPDDLSVPKGVLQHAFLEVVAGGELLTDVVDVVGTSLIYHIEQFSVVLNSTEQSLVVLRK